MATEQLAAVPELANLGPLFKSSQPVEITESETEYYVQGIKHTFSNYIVFQVSAHRQVGHSVWFWVSGHRQVGQCGSGSVWFWVSGSGSVATGRWVSVVPGQCGSGSVLTGVWFQGKQMLCC